MGRIGRTYPRLQFETGQALRIAEDRLLFCRVRARPVVMRAVAAAAGTLLVFAAFWL